MNRYVLRFAELATYGLIILSLIALAGYMVHLNRTGEAFGTVLGIIPVVVHAIGRIGQSQAMQSLADHLAQSTPVNKDTNP